MVHCEGAMVLLLPLEWYTLQHLWCLQDVKQKWMVVMSLYEDEAEIVQGKQSKMELEIGIYGP